MNYLFRFQTVARGAADRHSPEPSAQQGWRKHAGSRAVVGAQPLPVQVCFTGICVIFNQESSPPSPLCSLSLGQIIIPCKAIPGAENRSLTLSALLLLPAGEVQ